MWTLLGIVFFYGLPLAVAAWLVRSACLEYRRDRVPILLYHRLIREEDARRGRVRDDEMVWVCYDTRFAEQMDYLRQAGYTTLDLDDYLQIRRGTMPRPPRPVIITFDDGYESNYTLAYPALRRCRHKAVIFVAPEPDEHTRRLVAGIDGFLTPGQMQEMSAQGISIQSHTLTHCILTELSDEEVRRELLESRRRLEAITGRPVVHLAIPRAGYSRRIRRLVAEAGYLTACGNMKGSATGLSDLLALPRIVIERDMTLNDFARALEPRFSLMLRILGNIKRIPERVGGARFARRVRNLLYRGPMQSLFRVGTLKRIVLICGVLYGLGILAFTAHLLGWL